MSPSGAQCYRPSSQHVARRSQRVDVLDRSPFPECSLPSCHGRTSCWAAAKFNIHIQNNKYIAQTKKRHTTTTNNLPTTCDGTMHTSTPPQTHRTTQTHPHTHTERHRQTHIHAHTTNKKRTQPHTNTQTTIRHSTLEVYANTQPQLNSQTQLILVATPVPCGSTC